MRPALGCIAFGLLLLLVAGVFDAEPFDVAGAALVLVGAGAAAWVHLAGRGAEVERTVSRRTVTEEEPLEVRITVRAGRLPFPTGWIDEPLLPEPVPLRTGRRAQSVRIEARFARRGRRRLEPSRLVLRDPFGLARRAVASAHVDEVLVLPRVLPVRATATGGNVGVPAHARAALLAAAETEIDGLREHVEGSPANRIHWPTVARGGGLMERKLISEADSRPLVVLDPRAPATPEDLDAAVRATASLAVHFARASGCSLLLPGDRRAQAIEADLGSWPSAHVRLAVLDEQIGPSLAAAQNRRGLVVLVSARVIDRAPRGLGRTPGGCLIVVPGEIPGRRGVLEVAGCHGFPATRGAAPAVQAAVAAVGA
jgi:uncharacterized protein (DUF58 family)